MSITAIDPHRGSREAILEMLRDLLARAEAGEFRSVHACLFHASDGTMSRESAGHYDVFEAVAALEVAKFGIISRHTIRPEGEADR